MFREKRQSIIPEPIKRLVRREAGFGCCKCGNPVIEYHHIVPESKDPRDIMILCPICHHEATVGAMTEEEQRSYKLHPFNIKREYVKGKLKVNQNLPVVVIGSNQFVGEGDFLLVDKESLLSLEVNSGRLELSIKLYDHTDQLLAHIKNNEWISGDPMPWDLESSFQWLKIRHKLRDIAIEIDARKTPNRTSC
ncbi:MAG: HNH endonuclease [Moorellaceae bacterium]